MGTFVASYQVAHRMPSQFSKHLFVLNLITVSLWTREKPNNYERNHKKNEDFFQNTLTANAHVLNGAITHYFHFRLIFKK